MLYNNAMTRLVAFMTSFLFSYSAMASPYDPPKISPLSAGEAAPFDGTLFNEAAAAKVVVDIETQKEVCELDKNEALDRQKANHDLRVANLTAAKEAAERQAKEIVDLKNEQIKFLHEQAAKDSKKNKNVTGWLVGGVAGGVLAGVLLTIGAAYVVKEIRQ